MPPSLLLSQSLSFSVRPPTHGRSKLEVGGLLRFPFSPSLTPSASSSSFQIHGRERRKRERRKISQRIPLALGRKKEGSDVGTRKGECEGRPFFPFPWRELGWCWNRKAALAFLSLSPLLLPPLGLRERHRALRASLLLLFLRGRPLSQSHSASRPSYSDRRCTIESGRVEREKGERGEGLSRVIWQEEEKYSLPLAGDGKGRGTNRWR